MRNTKRIFTVFFLVGITLSVCLFQAGIAAADHSVWGSGWGGGRNASNFAGNQNHDVSTHTTYDKRGNVIGISQTRAAIDTWNQVNARRETVRRGMGSAPSNLGGGRVSPSYGGGVSQKPESSRLDRGGSGYSGGKPGRDSNSSSSRGGNTSSGNKGKGGGSSKGGSKGGGGKGKDNW